ncbi:MAG: gliding motility-associated C-terminal domain-containing protein [Flavobacteriales bacterium]
MTNKDNIKELFSKGLQDHQVSVDPALWSSISSSIGSNMVTTGFSLLSKVLIGVAASSMIGVAVYFSVQNTNTTNEKIKKEQKAHTPQPDETTSKEVNASSDQINLQVVKRTDTIQNQPISVVHIPIIDDTEFENQASMNQSHVAQNTTLSNFTIANPSQNTTISQANNASAQPTMHSNAQNQGVNQVQQAEKPKRIVLPNIFTPNGDGQNETLQINWQQADVKDFSIVILDAKNNVVYKDSNPQFEWDGTDLGGEKLSRGTYIYFVAAVLNGQKWQQSSSLQIQY